VKANAEQSGGIFNLFEVTCPAGFATSLHIHYAEDVAVFVLEGSLLFYCGDEEKVGPVGSYFFQPRGTPHGFRVSAEAPARFLYLTTPAGFDHYLYEGICSANESESMIAAARHKIEILGPLPE
jgi:quercetin dioxygenase-like cupin family protein